MMATTSPSMICSCSYRAWFEHPPYGRCGELVGGSGLVEEAKGLLQGVRDVCLEWARFGG
jgi:hypothetical protein